MKREASAFWQGDLKTGSGALTTGSRVLTSTPYLFHTRFEDGTGTNRQRSRGRMTFRPDTGSDRSRHTRRRLIESLRPR